MPDDLKLSPEQRAALTRSYSDPATLAEDDALRKVAARRLAQLIIDVGPETGGTIAEAWLNQAWRDGWRAAGGPDLPDFIIRDPEDGN